MIRKSISLKDYQVIWLDQHPEFSLSGMLQRTINEYILKEEPDFEIPKNTKKEKK